MSLSIIDFVKFVTSKTSKYEEVVNILKELLVSKFDFSEKYLTNDNFITKYPTLYSLVKTYIEEEESTTVKNWGDFYVQLKWPTQVSKDYSSYVNPRYDMYQFYEEDKITLSSPVSFIELDTSKNTFHYIKIDCIYLEKTTTPCIFFILDSAEEGRKIDFKIEFTSVGVNSPLVIFLDKQNNYINPTLNRIKNGLVVNNSVNVNGEEYYLTHSSNLKDTFGLDEFIFVKSNEHDNSLEENIYVEDWSEPFSKDVFTDYNINESENYVIFHNSTWNMLSKPTDKVLSYTENQKNELFKGNSVLAANKNKLKISTRSNVTGIFGQDNDFEDITVKSTTTYSDSQILVSNNKIAKNIYYPNMLNSTKLIYIENWNNLDNWKKDTGSILTTNARVENNTVIIDNNNTSTPGGQRHAAITSNYAFDYELSSGENLGYVTEIISANFTSPADAFIYPIWYGNSPNYFIMNTTNVNNRYLLTSSSVYSYSLMDYGTFTQSANKKIDLPIRIAQFIRNNNGIRETRAIVIDKNMVSVADSGWVSSGLTYSKGDTNHRLGVHNRNQPAEVKYGPMYFYKNLNEIEINNIVEYMKNNSTIQTVEPTFEYSGSYNIPYFKKDIFEGPSKTNKNGFYYKFKIGIDPLANYSVVLYTGQFNSKCRVYLKFDEKITVKFNNVEHIFDKNPSVVALYEIHFGAYFHENKLVSFFSLICNSFDVGGNVITYVICNEKSIFDSLSEADLLENYSCEKRNQVWLYWKPYIQTILIDDANEYGVDSYVEIHPILFKYNLNFQAVEDIFSDILNETSIKIYDSIYSNNKVENSQKYFRLNTLNNLIDYVDTNENSTYRISLIYDKNDSNTFDENENIVVLSGVEKTTSELEDSIEYELGCNGYNIQGEDYFKYQSNLLNESNEQNDLVNTNNPSNISNESSIVDSFECTDYRYVESDTLVEIIRHEIYSDIEYIFSNNRPKMELVGGGQNIYDSNENKNYSFNMKLNYSNVRKYLDTLNFNVSEGYYYVLKAAYVGDTYTINSDGSRKYTTPFFDKMNPSGLDMYVFANKLNWSSNSSINFLPSFFVDYPGYIIRLHRHSLMLNNNFNTKIVSISNTLNNQDILNRTFEQPNILKGEMVSCALSKWNSRNDDIPAIKGDSINDYIDRSLPAFSYGYDVTNIVNKYIDKSLNDYTLLIYNEDVTSYLMSCVPASNLIGSTDYWQNQLSDVKANLVLYIEKRQYKVDKIPVVSTPEIKPNRNSNISTNLKVSNSILNKLNLSSWKVLNKYKFGDFNV